MFFFPPGRPFVTNTMYFSYDCANLRCSNFIIFANFLVLKGSRSLYVSVKIIFELLLLSKIAYTVSVVSGLVESRTTV